MVGILDYGAGNLTSVRLAFERIGAPVRLVEHPEQAAGCDHLVFPGVGSAKSGMNGMLSRGLEKVLLEAGAAGTPVLAICLGMQMLFDRSEEDGGVEGMGILPGCVRLFEFAPELRVKIPQMGWNEVVFPRRHPVLAGIPSGTAFYFVHSYYVQAAEAADVAGRTEYAGFVFCSAAAKGSLFATQFHPERSGAAGLQMLRNFVAWDGGTGRCC